MSFAILVPIESALVFLACLAVVHYPLAAVALFVAAVALLIGYQAVRWLVLPDGLRRVVMVGLRNRVARFAALGVVAWFSFLIVTFAAMGQPVPMVVALAAAGALAGAGYGFWRLLLTR